MESDTVGEGKGKGREWRVILSVKGRRKGENGE